MFSSVCRYTVYHLNVTNRVLVLYLTTKKKLIMRATFVFALKLRDYQDNVDNSYFSLVVHKQLTLDDGNFYWTNYCDRQLFLIQTCILNFILISILFLKHCIRRIVHVMFRHLPKTILSNLLNICIIKHVMFHYNNKGLSLEICYCDYKGSKHWFKIQSAFYLRRSLPSKYYAS